jgi:hypothetical protein
VLRQQQPHQQRQPALHLQTQRCKKVAAQDMVVLWVVIQQAMQNVKMVQSLQLANAKTNVLKGSGPEGLTQIKHKQSPYL